VADLRSLVLVLGDQLDLEAAAFDGFDREHDAVWMAEVVEESTHVGSGKPRTALLERSTLSPATRAMFSRVCLAKRARTTTPAAKRTTPV